MSGDCEPARRDLTCCVILLAGDWAGAGTSNCSGVENDTNKNENYRYKNEVTPLQWRRTRWGEALLQILYAGGFSLHGTVTDGFMKY